MKWFNPETHHPSCNCNVSSWNSQFQPLNHQMISLFLLSVIFVSLVTAVNDGSQTHDGEEKENSPNGRPDEREKCVCLCVVVRGVWEGDSDAGLDIIVTEGQLEYLSQWEIYQVCRAAHHHHFLPVAFSISKTLQCHHYYYCPVSTTQ